MSATSARLDVLIVLKELVQGGNAVQNAIQSRLTEWRKFNQEMHNGTAALNAALGQLAVVFSGGALMRYAREAEQASRNQAQLAAILRSTGINAKEALPELEALAQSLQRKTGIDNDTILAAIRQLMTFGARREDLPELTETVLNLSAALGVDLSTAVMRFGAALRGEDFQLSRFHLNIDKTLSRSSQLKQALAQLSPQLAGQAAAGLAAIGPDRANFRQQADEARKGIGSLVLAVEDRFLEGVNNGLSRLNSGLKDLHNTGSPLLSLLESLANVLGRFIGNHIEGLTLLVAGLVSVKAAAFLVSGAWNAINSAVFILTGGTLLQYLQLIGQSLSVVARNGWTAVFALRGIEAAALATGFLAVIAILVSLVGKLSSIKSEAKAVADQMALTNKEFSKLAQQLKTSGAGPLADASAVALSSRQKLLTDLLTKIEEARRALPEPSLALRASGALFPVTDFEGKTKNLPRGQAEDFLVNQISELRYQLKLVEAELVKRAASPPSRLSAHVLSGAQTESVGDAEREAFFARQKELMAKWETTFRTGEITLEKYLSERRILTRMIQYKEIEHAQAEVERYRKQFEDPSMQSDERQTAYANLKKANANLSRLRADHAAQTNALNVKDAEDRNRIAAQSAEIEIKLAEARNQKLLTSRLKLNKELTDAISSDPANANRYQEIYRAGLDKLEQEAATERTTAAEQRYQQALDTTKNKIAIGSITQQEATRQNLALRDQYISALQTELSVLDQKAEKQDEDIRRIEELRAKLADLQTAQAQLAADPENIGKGFAAGFERAKNAIKGWGEVASDVVYQFADQFSTATSQAFYGFITGTKDAAEVFRQFAVSFIQMTIEMIVKYMVLRVLVAFMPGFGKFFGLPLNKGGLVPEKFAGGGTVGGSGDGDTVPAMLTPGEFVVSTRGVRALGYRALAAINAGLVNAADFAMALPSAAMPRPQYAYASGGPVSASPFTPNITVISPVNIGDAKIAGWFSTSEGQSFFSQMLGANTATIARNLDQHQRGIR